MNSLSGKFLGVALPSDRQKSIPLEPIYTEMDRLLWVAGQRDQQKIPEKAAGRRSVARPRLGVCEYRCVVVSGAF